MIIKKPPVAKQQKALCGFFEEYYHYNTFPCVLQVPAQSFRRVHGAQSFRERCFIGIVMPGNHLSGVERGFPVSSYGSVCVSACGRSVHRTTRTPFLKPLHKSMNGKAMINKWIGSLLSSFKTDFHDKVQSLHSQLLLCRA